MERMTRLRVGVFLFYFFFYQHMQALYNPQSAELLQYTSLLTTPATVPLPDDPANYLIFFLKTQCTYPVPGF